MRQVVQHLRSGSVHVEEVPAPAVGAPGVLVATACSLISPGTERAAVELGRSTLLGKALRRPDQVRKVLDNLRREGLRQTINKVQQRLDVTRALGYSCAGVVLESRECALRPGDRVACTGTDAATHAEINFVPRNLCAAIPEAVSFEEAAFVALGATALHAARLGGSAIGEDVAVLGLGPVGLLLAQILRAAGCRVCGFDLRADRLALAQQLGVANVAMAGESLEDNLRRLRSGFDAVYIAAASRSAEAAEWAVEAVRDRGKIVVVGDVRTDFPRNACYAKELSVVYARSYGPGRYDPQYEERGIDYPREYVRWTLGRNLEAFLDLLARGQVQVAPLITHRFPIEQAERAYEVVSGNGQPSLGVVLQYPLAETVAHADKHRAIELRPLAARAAGELRVGFIGAGSYATSYLLPALKSHAGVQLVSVATTRGVSARSAAEKFGFARCTTDAQEIIGDAEIDAVFIATRHARHGALARAAIEAGKAVFVEKPLCITEEELDAIAAAHAAHPVAVMVGHNRRFAPATRALMEFFGRGNNAATTSAPLSIRYTVHAGTLPAGHWLHDPAEGGRIIGEGCHFVDWCNFIAGAPLEKLFAATQGAEPDRSLHAVLNYRDGSVATIIYDTAAHHSLPKEVVEVSSGGRSATIENFAQAAFLTAQGRAAHSFRGKGQPEMIAAFIASLTSGAPPFTFDSWAASMRATLKLLESASTGLPVFFD